MFIALIAYNLCALFDELGHASALIMLGRPAKMEFAFDYVLKGITYSTTLGRWETVAVLLSGPLLALSLSYLISTCLHCKALLWAVSLREALSFYPLTHPPYTSHGAMLNDLAGFQISYLLMLLLASAILLTHPPQRHPLFNLLQHRLAGQG